MYWSTRLICNNTNAHFKMEKKSSKKKMKQHTPDINDINKKCAAADFGFDPFMDEEFLDIRTFVNPPREECPICFLPFPFEKGRDGQSYCCGQTICRGCLEDSFYGAARQRQSQSGVGYIHGDDITFRFLSPLDITEAQRCPFCRSEPPDGTITPLRKLVRQGNAGAMVSLAWATLHGDHGIPCDPKGAIELYHKAARAGSSKACTWLAERYWKGDIVVKRDLNKARRLFSRGARLGNTIALFNLGRLILRDGNDEESLDYWRYDVAAACGGLEPALNFVKMEFMEQRIGRADYARALLAYQAAQEETKSDSRDRYEKRLREHRTLNDLFDEMGMESLGDG